MYNSAETYHNLSKLSIEELWSLVRKQKKEWDEKYNPKPPQLYKCPYCLTRSKSRTCEYCGTGIEI